MQVAEPANTGTKRATLRFPKRPPVCYDVLEMKRLETVSDGFSEEGALAGELGGEDRVFLEQR